MYYPKGTEVWELSPSSELAQLVVRIKNEKGALARLSQAISACDVNMLAGFFTVPGKSRVATLSLFADTTDSVGGLTAFKTYRESQSKF